MIPGTKLYISLVGRAEICTPQYAKPQEQVDWLLDIV